MRKLLTSAAAIGVAMVLGALATQNIRQSWAQGFPFSVCFPGVQAQCTTDFGTPPISFTVQGGSTTTNGGTSQVVPIGSVAYSAFGAATTNIAGQVFVASIFVASDRTITNINVLMGGTVGTDKGIAALYNNNGVLIANSALAGIATAGANTFLVMPLTTPIAIQGPGRYFIAYQPNGTTDIFRSVATSTFVNVLTQSNAGTFGTLPALTPPTTFTGTIGPIAYLN
jgi:hypothetical protein